MDNAQTTQRQQVSPARRCWGLLLSLAGSALLTQAVCAVDKSGVTPNTVSLPKGPGSIEGLGEAFEPLLSDGTGKYAVALRLPPGPAGHTPTLVLRYEGGNGDGPLGIGWRLDVPAIQRDTEKGIPRYVDGPNAVDDDHDGEIDEADEVDVFVDSDAEELVPVASADGVHADYFRRHEDTFIRYRRQGDAWEGRLPDGTVLGFGLTAAGRVTDETGTRTFTWLLERSTDTSGNTIVFLYHSVADTQNTNQVYLAEIRYGPGAPTTGLTWPSFHFVRFDYESRPGWFEDCRSGFVMRTGMRLIRIVVGTRGPDLSGHGHATGDYNQDGTSDFLDRAYRLAYDADPHGSLLSSITPVGADGISTLPPVTFTYSTATYGAALSAAGAIIGAENEPPQVMDLAWIDLLDFNGDGLPDILRTDPFGGPHTVYLNRGEVAQDGGLAVRWSAGIEVGGDARAWPVNLADDHGAIAHLADMDADGLSDLVLVTATDTYYFPNRPSAAAPAWDERRRMHLAEDGSTPPAPFGSAEVKTADLDFDKRIDIIQSLSVANEARYRVWFNLDGQRYTRGVTVTPEQGFLFSDTGVHIADLNGDRVPDIARIKASELWVTPGLGYGRFGTLVPVSIPDWTLEAAQVERAVLEDVTGDGLADLVVERAAPGQLWLWVNRGNYTLGTRCVVTGLPAQFGTAPARRWADLNGNGTVDLVTADSAAAPRLQAVDIGRLLGCVPTPHLLVGIDNGLGRRITIDYTTSTEFALADAAAGTPWPNPLPFPVDVVAGVTVDDTRSNLTRTDLSYHEGYYDPQEHTFCGFARVVQTEPGDETAPTLVSRSLFHTGKGNLAMKGKLLGTSAEEEDGGIFEAETTTWTTRVLYPGLDGRAVRFAHPTGRARDLIERGQGVPRRTETEYAYDDYGNETARREYGIVEGNDRDAGADERIALTEYAHNLDDWLVRFPKRTTLHDLGGTVISREETFYDDPTFSGTNLGAVTAGLPTLVRRWIDPAEDGAFVEAVRTHYDAYGNPVALLDPLALAPGGVVDDGAGHYRTVDYDGAFHTYPVSETVHIEAGKEDLLIQASYDVGLGTLTASVEPNGHTTAYGYDVFGRLVHILRPGDDPGYPSLEAEYVLGFPAGAGRSAQDPPSTPSPSPVINWVETRRLDQAPGTATTKRDHYLISRAFVDGLGRQVMAKAEAEDEPATGTPRAVVEGAVRFNARGTAARTLNPFYTLAGGDLDAQLAFEDIAAPDWQGSFHQEGEQITLGLMAAHAVRTFYDATLRVRRTVNPDGTATETAYVPLGVTAADENDTDPASPYHGTPTARWSDGLDRLIRVDEIVRLNDDGTPSAALQTWSTAYQYRADGALTLITDSQNNRKAFEYDALGRKTILRDPDRGIMAYAYDAASNLLQTTDARNQTVTYTYDGANRLLTETYAAGGKGALPPDPRRGVTDSPDPSSLARGPGHASATTVEGTRVSHAPVLAPVEREVWRAEVLQQGDAERGPERPSAGGAAKREARGDSVPRTKAAHVIYHYDAPAGTIDFGNGEAGTAANTRGRLAWVQDQTGEEHTSYDERGREAWVVKCIPDPINGMPVPYRTALTHDAMDRLVELVYPDEDRCTYEYNHRGLLERITGGETANLAGTPYILAQADYAPSGQPVETLYGNGVRTTHRYDARLRQTRLRASPAARTHRTPATPLIDFSYSFDSSSNLLRIHDLRDGTQRPAGDPLRNTQLFGYDDLYRLTRVQYSLALPGAPDRNDGHIAYRYDRIGNMLEQTSDLVHADERTGLPVCDLGQMASGGALGAWNRVGRTAGDPPGPHALTGITPPGAKVPPRGGKPEAGNPKPIIQDPKSKIPTPNSELRTPNPGARGTARAYPYDANGNLTGIDGLACTWDVLDRLVAVEDGRLRAEYAYDYTGRRIWKRVWQKDGAGAPEVYPSTTTLYVGRHFEVREYDQPTKYVFAGDTRVATVTGTLNGDPHRTQRLRLFAGWNLLALAVSLSTSAPLFAVASAAFLWDPDGGGYLPVGPADPLPAGSILWLNCAATDTLVVAGVYAEPASYPVPAGASFVSGPPLAAWQADAVLPAATRTWRFAAAVQQWEMNVPADLAFLSPFPAFVAAGEPVFVVSSDPSGVILQPSSLRILYYHQDHLGSSAIVADAAGTVVDETAYYPYGYPRHHDRPEAARSVLPSRYGFTQKEQDEETGLHYFEARYLVAALGRFASTDPLVATPTKPTGEHAVPDHAYAYAAGNPVRYTDPTGRTNGDSIERPKGTRETLMRLMGLHLDPVLVRERAQALERRESPVASVAPSGAIQYTAQSGGCVTVTVRTAGGRMVGGHFGAMEEVGATWAELLGAMRGEQAAEVHVDWEPPAPESAGNLDELQWAIPTASSPAWLRGQGPLGVLSSGAGGRMVMEESEITRVGRSPQFQSFFAQALGLQPGNVRVHELAAEEAQTGNVTYRLTRLGVMQRQVVRP